MTVRPFAALVVLGLISAAPAGAACAAPRRVMSINACADQLVLALLPPDRITSVSWLARSPSTSHMVRAASRVPANRGTAEEVVRDRPDLVIAGAYTSPSTRALLARLRFPVLVLEPASSFADVRRDIRRVAVAVGEPARGEAEVARMDATLAGLAAHKLPPLRVAAWDGAGVSAQPGGLYDAILTAAGARNVAADAGVAGRGSDVEALLAAAPQLLVSGEPGLEAPDRRSDLAHHPLVRRFWATARWWRPSRPTPAARPSPRTRPSPCATRCAPASRWRARPCPSRRTRLGEAAVDGRAAARPGAGGGGVAARRSGVAVAGGGAARAGRAAPEPDLADRHRHPRAAPGASADDRRRAGAVGGRAAGAAAQPAGRARPARVSSGASLGAVIAIYYGVSRISPLAGPAFGLLGGWPPRGWRWPCRAGAERWR